MPNPKRRHSKSRGRKRRTHDALQQPRMTECPHCHELKSAHQVCPHCGQFDGREYVAQKAKES